MTKFNGVKLTDAVRCKVVIVYIGCKLLNIEECINDIVNKLVLGGISGKKVTFSNLEVIYETQELIDFVYDRAYEEMERILYPDGNLNDTFMSKSENPYGITTVFSELISKIFNMKYFNEVDEEDICNAFSDTITLRTNSFGGEDYIPRSSSIYKHNALVEKAVKDYLNI